MKDRRGTPHSSLKPALEAIANLFEEGFAQLRSSGSKVALVAHSEIERTPVNRNKTGPFYEHLVPLRNEMVRLLADTYRRYIKLALAHPRQVGLDPGKWAWDQLQPVVGGTLEWIRGWYILACDGENQYVRHTETMPVVPGQTVSTPIPLTAPPVPPPKSWRAPSWLFEISLPVVGVGALKEKHVPATDSDPKLGAAHTRLLLKGAQRVFWWQLAEAIKRVRNEETAAAGAIPAQTMGGGLTGEPKKPKYWLKGTEGLTRKADLSRYKQGLTEKQELAFSLRYEYQVGPAEVAARMGIDRKTAHEHIEAANRKIKQLHSSEKRKANRAKSTPDL